MWQIRADPEASDLLALRQRLRSSYVISEIAGLQGELRFAHLNAHVVMSRVLSSQQIAAYDRLRGYDGGSDNAIHPHND